MPESAAAAGAAFTLRCLGPVALTDAGGRRLSFRTRKQMALLFVLAAKPGKPAGREQLVDLLWSEDDSRAARHSLAQSISLINKVLGTEAISFAGKDQVCLRDGLVDLDVEAFERAAREGRAADADAAWRGMLVEGLWIRRAPNFDRWVETERERLRRIRRRVLHDLVTAERRSGNWGDMRARAEALLDDDPLDETAMLAWLEAVTLGGDRSLALRRFGEFEARLREELDADPGEGLRVWARQNRRGERAPTASLPRVGETIALPTVQPVYGRETEYSELWETWAAAGRREGSFVILEGASGIGKSALATKLVNQVHVAGGSVCYVRCYRTEKAVPFAPITALTRQLSRLPGFVALEAVWIGELSRLVPELRVRFPGAPAPMAVDDSARLRICDAMLQAAQCVADEQPLMIVVDDIQDADEATLALLHYFGRQTPGSPTLLLCVARPNAAQTELERNFFETARHAGFARFVFLGALAAEPTWRLLRHVLAQRGLDAPDWVLTRLHEITEGIPLHAIEAAMALPAREQRVAAEWEEALRVHLSPGGENFDRSAADRLAALSADARCVAGVLAVAARPLTDYELTAVSELPATDLASAVFVLETANFVRRSGGQLTFAHERYLASSLAELPGDQRRDMHARLAELLTRSAAENPAARYEVAQHFEQAGRVADAREQALAAAMYAGSLRAVRERVAALQLLRRLSDEHDWGPLSDLARCLLNLKDVPALTALCNEVAVGWSTTAAVADFAYFRIAADHYSGQVPISATRDKLLKLFADTSVDFGAKGESRLLLIRTADKSGEHALARRTARATRRDLKARTNPEGLGLCLLVTAFVLIKYYRPAKALPLILQALDHAQRSNDWSLEQWCREGLGAAYLQLGRYRDSVDSIDHALALARKLLDPFAEALALSDRAVTEMALGDFGAAEISLRASSELGDRHPGWPLRVYPVLNEASLRLHQGRYREAASEFERAIALATRIDSPPNIAYACAGRALVAARTRDLSGLRSWSQRAINQAPEGAREIHDRHPFEAAIAWDRCLNGGQVSKAIDVVERCCHELRHRNADHWLRLDLERIRLIEYRDNRRLVQARAKLAATAARLEATAIADEATAVRDFDVR